MPSLPKRSPILDRQGEGPKARRANERDPEGVDYVKVKISQGQTTSGSNYAKVKLRQDQIVKAKRSTSKGVAKIERIEGDGPAGKG